MRSPKRGCGVHETEAGYGYGPTETDYRRLLPIPIPSAGQGRPLYYSSQHFSTVNITLGCLIFWDVINGRGIVTMPAANQTRLQLICRILLYCVHRIYCNIASHLASLKYFENTGFPTRSATKSAFWLGAVQE